MKQVIGGFSYQFWSRSVPKLKRYLKKDEKHPIEFISDKEEQKKIVNTIKAIEGYVMFSCIALGMLQLISLTFSGEISKKMRYLRTPSKETVSEATVASYLSRNIYWFMLKTRESKVLFILLHESEYSFFMVF